MSFLSHKHFHRNSTGPPGDPARGKLHLESKFQTRMGIWPEHRQPNADNCSSLLSRAFLLYVSLPTPPPPLSLSSLFSLSLSLSLSLSPSLSLPPSLPLSP